MNTWIRIAVIVVLAIVLWYLVINLTQSMTAESPPAVPPAQAQEAPSAPGQTP